MTRRSRAETREAEALLASHEDFQKNLRPSVQPPARTGRLGASIQEFGRKARAAARQGGRPIDNISQLESVFLKIGNPISKLLTN